MPTSTPPRAPFTRRRGNHSRRPPLPHVPRHVPSRATLRAPPAATLRQILSTAPKPPEITALRKPATRDRLFAATGDEVEGKIIQDVGFPWLNDRGEVAFWAQFDDGSEAILFGNGLHAPQSHPRAFYTASLVAARSPRYRRGSLSTKAVGRPRNLEPHSPVGRKLAGLPMARLNLSAHDPISGEKCSRHHAGSTPSPWGWVALTLASRPFVFAQEVAPALSPNGPVFRVVEVIAPGCVNMMARRWAAPPARSRLPLLRAVVDTDARWRNGFRATRGRPTYSGRGARMQSVTATTQSWAGARLQVGPLPRVWGVIRSPPHTGPQPSDTATQPAHMAPPAKTEPVLFGPMAAASPCRPSCRQLHTHLVAIQITPPSGLREGLQRGQPCEDAQKERPPRRS